MDDSFVLVTSDQFYDVLVEKVQNAKHHIYLQAMEVEFGDRMLSLQQELIAARKRGVIVRLNIDWFSTMVTDSHANIIPIITPHKRKAFLDSFKKNRQMIAEMEHAGVKVVYSNRSWNIIGDVFYMLGRNHIKIYIIDDTAYIGGMNMQQKFFGIYADFVVQITKPDIVEALTKQFFKINGQTLHTDSVIYKSPTDTIYVDVGKSGRSIIYEHAVTLINHAKTSVVYVSKMLPDAELLQALNKAQKRGVQVDIITADKNVAISEFEYRIKKTVYDRQQHDLTLYLYPKTYIHAKLLVVDNSIAYFGSHNYTKIGVMFGTNEIAMQTTHKRLTQQLSTWADGLKYASTLSS